MFASEIDRRRPAKVKRRDRLYRVASFHCKEWLHTVVIGNLSTTVRLQRNQSRCALRHARQVAFSSRKSHLGYPHQGHCYSDSALIAGNIAPNASSGKSPSPATQPAKR